MDLKNRVLTVNLDTARRVGECIAACKVELNPLETAALLNPLHPGFTLKCVLLGIDPGTDPVIFTFPKVKTFKSIIDILDVNQVFKESLSFEILDEDVSGRDELKAKFTLVDNSTGQRVIKRSNQVNLVL